MARVELDIHSGSERKSFHSLAHDSLVCMKTRSFLKSSCSRLNTATKGPYIVAKGEERVPKMLAPTMI